MVLEPPTVTVINDQFYCIIGPVDCILQWPAAIAEGNMTIIMSTVAVLSLCLCTLLASATCHGAGRSVCPESKKLYPGDCRLFYKCVPMPGAAQAYVWVPSRCTAGLIFDRNLGRCVLRGAASGDCGRPGEDSAKLDPLYSLVSADEEGGMEMTDHPATSTAQTDGISTSGFNDDDKSAQINSASKDASVGWVSSGMDANSLPLSAVNSPPLDAIGAQMHRLTQLINGLRAAASTHKLKERPAPDLSHPLTRIGLDFLPEQISKIAAQLMWPAPKTHQIIKSNSNKNPGSPSKVVANLYQKYLSNNTFLKKGEFHKATTVNKLMVVARPLSGGSGIASPSPVPQPPPRSDECRLGERLENPRNCTKYFICKEPSGGVKLSFNCPAKTAFSKSKKVCNLEEFMRCQQF